MNELMKSLAYFPWIALAGACLVAVTFLILWGIAEHRLDKEADAVHALTEALEECEDELLIERLRLDEAREEIAMQDRENNHLLRELGAAKREVNRLKPRVEVSGNRFEPGGPISIHGRQR